MAQTRVAGVTDAALHCAGSHRSPMLRRHTRRLTTTCFVVLALLWSQLALAAYACPQQSNAEVMAAMMAASQPCDGMDPEQPALCHAHTADPGKTFEALKLPTVSLPAVVQVLALARELDARQACAVPGTATPEAQPPPDPLFLSTLRLRV